MYNIFFLENSINKKHRSELEEIFYFNINQKRYTKKIEDEIAIYGHPFIDGTNESINLRFSKVEKTLTLYALDRQTQDAELLGVLVYTFEGNECKVIHIAIQQDCCIEGTFSDQLITFRLFEKLRLILIEKRPQIKSISIPYKSKKINIKSRVLQSRIELTC